MSRERENIIRRVLIFPQKKMGGPPQPAQKFPATFLTELVKNDD